MARCGAARIFWDIAKHVYHDQDVSRDQVMLALLKASPPSV